MDLLFLFKDNKKSNFCFDVTAMISLVGLTALTLVPSHTSMSALSET